MKTRDMTLVAMFTSIIVVLAMMPPIPLPFSPVPITLQMLGVLLSAALLGSRLGFLSLLTYILLGAIGLPVFAGGAGGFSIIVGPTGGYIIGFAIGAFIIGWLLERVQSPQLHHYFFAMIAGLLVVYTIGTIQLAAVTQMGFMNALKVGSLPFIPLDIVKVVVATGLAYPIKNRLTKQQMA